MDTQDIGRATCRSTPNVLRLFGGYGSPGDPASWPAFEKTLDTVWGAKEENEARLWLVHGRGSSQQRFNAADPLAPLPRRDVNGSPRPFAKLAISVKGMAVGAEPLVIDGDQSIEVVASQLSVKVLVPEGVYDVDDPTVRNLEVAPGQLVVDDLIGCRVLKLQVSRGLSTATLTTYLYAPPNTAASLAIPRGAVSVEVSPAQADGGEWEWHEGDPVTLAQSTLLGTFVPGAPQRVPSASHLAVAAGVERFFTLTWTIRA